ncbi:MAG TPA: hypothetical protein VN726_13965 [Hanamia sp.]|nr:hypothetical protein [Hanamia sp.]
MQHNKLFSAATIFCMIAFFLVSWMPSPMTVTNRSGIRLPMPITIMATYDNPDAPFTGGTFWTSGALMISGTATMAGNPNINFKRAHCEIILTSADGTITIHQECNFATPTPQGRWEIVSSTGVYSGLRANGSLTMPGNSDLMVGSIY